jgi:hypothetical protein
MIYLKWKLSDAGVSGTGPEGEIDDRGGHAEAGWAVDNDGYRIGYLTQTADLTGLATWDLTEVTEAQALVFSQAIWADAEVMADGRISSPPPPEVTA